LRLRLRLRFRLSLRLSLRLRFYCSPPVSIRKINPCIKKEDLAL